MSAIVLNQELASHYDNWISARRRFFEAQKEYYKAQTALTNATNAFAIPLMSKHIKKDEKLVMPLNGELLEFSKDNDTTFFIEVKT